MDRYNRGQITYITQDMGHIYRGGEKRKIGHGQMERREWTDGTQGMDRWNAGNGQMERREWTDGTQGMDRWNAGNGQMERREWTDGAHIQKCGRTNGT